MTKILIDRSVVEQALEAMLNFPDDISDDMFNSIAALKAALAEPVQEPAGWLENPFGSFRRNWLWRIDPPPQSLAWSIPLYAALPQRPSKPTTEQPSTVEPVQEPVAWIHGDEFGDVCHWVGGSMPPAGTKLYTAPPQRKPMAWMPIETAPKGRILLVYYLNNLGNGRTMRARYYLPETLDSDTTESGWAGEGWYEESEAYEYLMPLDGDPTHWMPLPEAPEQAHGIKENT